MGLKLKKYIYNIFFILCIIIIIFIITSIIYKYTKQNVINNKNYINKFDKFDNTPIYSLPPDTMLANIPSTSRFFKNISGIFPADNSTLDSKSCGIIQYIPAKKEGDLNDVTVFQINLPPTSAISGIALMACANDPTKYLETFQINFLDENNIVSSFFTGLYSEVTNFNTNLTGDSNQISYILFPNILINKSSILIIPITWNNQIDSQTASQTGIRCDLLSSLLPNTALEPTNPPNYILPLETKLANIPSGSRMFFNSEGYRQPAANSTLDSESCWIYE
jgi:hypothetical protein